ncbi:hypothetical protein AVEN_197340-1, partial [Araneus ventricosus]
DDNSIYEANRKFSKKYIEIPLIIDTDGVKYTPLDKADALKYSLEISFQTNPESYDDNQIPMINKAVRQYIRKPRQ